ARALPARSLGQDAGQPRHGERSDPPRPDQPSPQFPDSRQLPGRYPLHLAPRPLQPRGGGDGGRAGRCRMTGLNGRAGRGAEALSDEGLRHVLADALETLRSELARQAPFLAGRVAQWLDKLAPTGPLAGYVMHPAAYPLFLLPWHLARSIGAGT